MYVTWQTGLLPSWKQTLSKNSRHGKAASVYGMGMLSLKWKQKLLNLIFPGLTQRQVGDIL